MPALLVSVRNSQEAATALAGGADVIDVKEPARGALGPADAQCWSQVVARVAGRVPVSVALGELVDYRPRQAARDWRGVGFAKLGLAGCRNEATWPGRWAEAIDGLPAEVRSVAVVYADAASSGSPLPEQVLRHAWRVGCWGILFDTCHKRGPTLLDWLPPPRLAEYIELAHQRGMAVALAGSIDCRNIDEAIGLRPDLIAVRGAACRGGRRGEVELEKVRRLAQIVKQASEVPHECPFPVFGHD